jgi:hypothetical protein
MSGTFSKRMGIGSCSGPPIFDEAPEGLRIGLWNYFEDLTKDKRPPTSLPGFGALYDSITMNFHLLREDGPRYGELIKMLLIYTLSWNQIYDLIEFIFTEVYYIDRDEGGWFPVPKSSGDARYQYTIAINKILASENIGWRLIKGKLERVGSEVLDHGVLIAARKLLLNPDFAGPNLQFNKSLEFFNKRPKPDLENCVKDAVGALEGLGRIILKDKKITLGKAIELLSRNKLITKPLDMAFHGLYGYASTQPGSRHGAHALPTIDLHEAEFVLYSAATCMLFLAKKCSVMPPKPAVGSTKALQKAPSASEFPAEDGPEFPEDDDVPPREEAPDEFPSDDELPF